MEILLSETTVHLMKNIVWDETKDVKENNVFSMSGGLENGQEQHLKPMKIERSSRVEIPLVLQILQSIVVDLKQMKTSNIQIKIHHFVVV